MANRGDDAFVFLSDSLPAPNRQQLDRIRLAQPSPTGDRNGVTRVLH